MAETLTDLIGEAFERYERRTAVRVLRKSNRPGPNGLRWEPMTYRRLREQRDQLAKGLAVLGVGRGQRVGIVTGGGLESILIFLACDLLGASSVPLCNKLPDDLFIHMLDRALPTVLFSDIGSYDQVARVLNRLHEAPKIVLTNGQRDGATTVTDVILSGHGLSLPVIEVSSDDESKVIFTSGSSGMPKGVIQTHGNIVSNIRKLWDCLSSRDDMVFFKSAPDFHTMGILNIYYPLARGWTLDLARSPDHALTDLRYSEPHGLVTVPLLLDKVYQTVRKEIAMGGFRGKLIAQALRAKIRIVREEASLLDFAVHGLIGRKVIGKIRKKLSQRVGSRLELLIVGAAKGDPDALDFFHDVLDIKTYEGYGTTESCSLISSNHIGARKTGTVGRPFFPVRLMVDGREVGNVNPQTGTVKSSNGQAGELWVCGGNVMRGYIGEPELTAQTLVKGAEGSIWYRTGDLFSADGDGFLTFAGRLGRQFKLRNGEFVNPEHLERIYSRVSLVDHVLVCGDQSRAFPIPVVNVNLEEMRLLTELTDLAADDAAARRDPRLVRVIRDALLKEAIQAGTPSYERPQRVVVSPEPFNEENGTLTRGLKKPVPKAIEERYRVQIISAYEADQLI